jgi:hypothetical protein
MMAFPITELLDEQGCYEFLLSGLHPKGLQCPAGHRVVAGQAPHMSDRAPVVSNSRSGGNRRKNAREEGQRQAPSGRTDAF